MCREIRDEGSVGNVHQPIPTRHRNQTLWAHPRGILGGVRLGEYDVLWTPGVLLCGMFRRLLYGALDNTAHLFMLARLRLHDRIAGPAPERSNDRAIREEGERLRKAF